MLCTLQAGVHRQCSGRCALCSEDRDCCRWWVAWRCRSARCTPETERCRCSPEQAQLAAVWMVHRMETVAGPAAAEAEALHPALQEEGWPPLLQGCACAVWTGAARGACRACTCKGQQMAGGCTYQQVHCST